MSYLSTTWSFDATKAALFAAIVIAKPIMASAAIEVFCCDKLGSLLADFLSTPNADLKKSLGQISVIAIPTAIATYTTSYFLRPDSKYINIGVVSAIFFISITSRLIWKIKSFENQIHESVTEGYRLNQEQAHLNQQRAYLNQQLEVQVQSLIQQCNGLRRTMDLRASEQRLSHFDLAFPKE